MYSDFDNLESKNIGVSVHVGFPNAAEDHVSQALDFNDLLVRNPSSTYCFRIEGTSYEDRGIFDGDIAVIDRSLAPMPDDLVLFFADSDSSSGFVITQYRTLRSRPEIWGVVTSTIHITRKRRA
jgi:DNA polymerase V